jgi:hypothetical protein
MNLDVAAFDDRAAVTVIVLANLIVVNNRVIGCLPDLDAESVVRCTGLAIVTSSEHETVLNAVVTIDNTQSLVFGAARASDYQPIVGGAFEGERCRIEMKVCFSGGNALTLLVL